MNGVILDLSRLISRIRHPTPTGVDRVEMAYARGLLQRFGQELSFAAVHPTGLYGRLRRQAALAYLDELERRWALAGSDTPHKSSITAAIPWLTALRPLQSGIGSGGVYVQVSPHHLTRTQLLHKILKREQASFLCMVHDLIPIEFPEYARPGGAELHCRRMETVAQLADAVIVNSQATAASLGRWLDNQGRDAPPIHVNLLGTEAIAEASLGHLRDRRPTFLCLGTIEPRKNHLLLLHLWRQLADELAEDDMPRLQIVGRRGWENEQVLDLLDRSPSLKKHVVEIDRCSDEKLGEYLRNARALLMPSFAEGYGMPVAEALSVGTPVIASDIDAHREVGREAPDFLDPLDGPGWKRAIMDYCREGPMRRAQLERLHDWRAPSWHDHLDSACQIIQDLGRR